MRRRRKFDIYFLIGVFIFTLVYFIYSQNFSESKGLELYTEALRVYKTADYENAYRAFGKIPSGSSLKQAALFRQARCAENLGKQEKAIKKYKRIINSHSKTAIIPISEYNLANILYEKDKKKAKSHYLHLQKKYPSSDYAIIANYYLGIIEIEHNSEIKIFKKKAEEKAMSYFKNYLEQAPAGRFSINVINEITKLKTDLSNYDNLLIAKSYYLNGEYTKAGEYLNKTTLSESWTDFAKNEFSKKNYEKTRYYTEKGLKEYSDSVNIDDIYEVMDNYILTYPTRTEGIKKLLSLNLKSNGADYVEYLNCSELVQNNLKESCYRTLYEKYPNGRFSGETLYNIFITKYLQKKYYDAQRLGFLHMKKFPNIKSSPAVTYFMGKIAYKLKRYESADSYYKQVLQNYPDSYYAFRANFNLNKENGFLPFLEIKEKQVVFPYRKSLDNNLVVKLAYLKDYALVEELCKKDKFIQSWLAYEKGEYTLSAIMARNAMEELDIKPNFDDLRWRLVYPIHYYDVVEKVKGTNNPIILESIIKEESHFNKYAKSYAGAYGLMQLMPSTYNEVVKQHNLPSDLSTEYSNILAGSLYYAGLRRAFVNKDLYAISAYNGGMGSVKSWFSNIIYNDTDEFVEQIPYPETKNYVKKVLRTYWMYGNIY